MMLFRYGAGFLAAAALAFAACGPSTEDGTQVHVSTTEDSVGGAPVQHETTVVVTPPATTPDTVTNTVVEHHTDTVVKVVPGKTDTVPRTPPASTVSAGERAKIDAWLAAHTDSLNRYGDPIGTAYTGGTPLFNESTGQTISKYDYIVRQHPDRPWMKASPVESTPRR
jgi:hypothetical protein